HIFLSTVPSEHDLERRLNDIAPATSKPKKVNTRAFYEPLRSSILMRCALYMVLIVVATFVLGAMRWGNGAIQGDNTAQLWPLQCFSELAVFTATNVIRDTSDLAAGTKSPDYTGIDHYALHEIVSHFNVVIGSRPNMQQLLKETLTQHKAQQSSVGSIGTIVSGPNALKKAANEPAIALGAKNLDIHEEEFEL
ncbi:hypothetical protein THRCLA_00029, partial [Thraustotheca clavata]